jgi:hypothetical protein
MLLEPSAQLTHHREADLWTFGKYPLELRPVDQRTAWAEILLRGLGDTAQIGRSEFGEKRHLAKEQNPLHERQGIQCLHSLTLKSGEIAPRRQLPHS